MTSRSVWVCILLCFYPVVFMGCEGYGPYRREIAEVKLTAKAKACVECHRTKGISAISLRDWELSAHAINEVGCDQCHLPVEDVSKAILDASTVCEDKSVRRSVSPRNCEKCHVDQVRQFASGKHAMAWDILKAMPTTKEQPQVLIEGEKGCGGCHRIGRDEGKCDSCHTRHRFSAAEARRPEACQSCHIGHDHPQWEMYSTSKHGSIYAVEGQNWYWNKRIAEWYTMPLLKSPVIPRAPVCITCHMPDGNHAVKTSWGFWALRLSEKDEEWRGYRNTIFKGLGFMDKEGNLTERFKVFMPEGKVGLTTEEWQAGRDKMIKICAKCHAYDYSKTTLDRADEVIKDCDKLMAEAIEIVDGLYEDGILPKVEAYPPHTDLLRYYEVKHPIELRLYTMFLVHRMRAYQGAFHINPNYQQWYGWAEMKMDLQEIKNMAERLRAEKR
ncbi:MAG TPA: multiheme c-type cytochrome [Candidatus Brocadiales bacterium]|nr:multiheme c-type cytochrome [Candidatus Brocadiales bacterium]